ncbi:MAG: PQQ-binding-like beta-propeller repeat protein [Gemmataceae bacterium]|nr:PQQ-binding-like beta-propeller repeat protein [Gemmataceae bacterium]
MPPALRLRVTGILLTALALLLAIFPERATPQPERLPLPQPETKAAAQPAEGAADEKLLRDAGLRTDGPGLLEYFRQRTPSGNDRERLAALVQQLGDRTFSKREKATRELITAGERALEFLRAAVKDPSDEEMRRRAEQCVRLIEQVPHGARNAAAARLLAVRRPPGAAAVLLAYLPSADWNALGDDLLAALATVGIDGKGKDAAPVKEVVAALADREEVRRAAAAHVLGQAGIKHRAPLARLISDPSPLVRYHAAAALVRGRDPRGLPVLIALIGEGPPELLWRAEDLLTRVAGEQAPPPVTGAPASAEARKKWHASWDGWWQASRAKLDLAKIDLEEAALGLTVVCEVDGVGQFPGRICEFDRAGNLRWMIDGFHSPTDVQRLPSGRVLVAESWTRQVTERDRAGKIIWTRKLDDMPTSAQRLRNGNTLISTYNSVLEVTPDDKVVFNYRHSGSSVYCACKLRNGHVLLIDGSGKVAELDAAGKQVMTFTPEKYTGGAGYWAAIEPLRDGRYLICLSGQGKVVETDARGKVHWECSVPTPCYANRLANGHTLVANVDGRYVVEVDREGKEVWRKATKGRPFRARRY